MNVTAPPIGAGSGAAFFVIPRFEAAWTSVSAVDALSFGSGSLVVVEIVAVFDNVEPFVSAGLVLSTSVKTSLPGENAGRVQLTVPVAPGAGVVQLQPAIELIETNVVPAGSASFRTTFCASSGPSLLIVIV